MNSGTIFLNRVPGMSVAALTRIICLAALLFIVPVASAEIVRVEGELTGTGITRKRGFDCFVITAAHVVGQSGRALNATSDDYALKRGGWSLLFEGKWQEMGLQGFFVTSVREEGIWLHFGTYGGYFRSRGFGEPALRNDGFPGTPYINALEPTPNGVFAGLGPGGSPKDGSGLWFLKKDANRWVPVEYSQEEDIHTLASNRRFLFAGDRRTGFCAGNLMVRAWKFPTRACLPEM
jgi:hypothetical protein